MRPILSLLVFAVLAIAVPLNNQPAARNANAVRELPEPGFFVESFGVTQDTAEFHSQGRMHSVLSILFLAAFAVAVPLNDKARVVPIPGAFVEGSGITQETKDFALDVAARAIPVPGAFVEGSGVMQDTKDLYSRNEARAIPVPGAFVEGFGVTQNTEEWQ
ncbi:hypothetical protein EVG20_g8285 [Dentipellis fragilis]|uniref:Uncharacterized protein n=1 Tax=Dentipellis fragilis TaxID=205917 RepID=A0A4Y9YB54_9AGAM|nr:hypothetical protein EVG20_g8285 [Dentipellis fragilis]